MERETTNRFGDGKGPVALSRSATVPLGIVSLLLTPQDPRRKISATFPMDVRLIKKGEAGSEKVSASFQGIRARFLRGTHQVKRGPPPEDGVGFTEGPPESGADST
jgi:hypothetical protein